MSRIVVDVGCYPHTVAGKTYASIPRLVARFNPRTLYGFDPWPDMWEYEALVGACKVVGRRRAAWTYDGKTEFVPHDLGSTVMREKDMRGEWRHHYIYRVPCFDFSAWLAKLPEPAVVKLDCEGAEFPILNRIVMDGTDRMVELLLIEWHDQMMEASSEFALQRERLLNLLRCPVETWQD